MTNKQTAVEWFVTQLEEHLLSENIKIDLKNTEAFEQAKQMERKQIEEAYNQDLYGGLSGDRKYEKGSDYFTKTYQNGKDS